jgi:hypothetical protein
MNRALALMLLLASSASDAKPVKIERNSAVLEFTYEWSPEAAAIPALDRKFRADLAKYYREALANAREDQKLARQQKRDFNSHYFSQQWTTAGQSPRLLSLESEFGSFTGGAHPNTSYDALLWDRWLASPVDFNSQFLRSGSFATLTRSTYCRKLDSERLKRREGEKLGGDFDECPKYSDLAIAPTDKNRDGRFETLRFVASPYVAGPYVEGEYEIEVPVTRQLIAAMKPVYRSSYAPQRQ